MLPDGPAILRRCHILYGRIFFFLIQYDIIIVFSNQLIVHRVIAVFVREWFAYDGEPLIVQRDYHVCRFCHDVFFQARTTSISLLPSWS